MRFWAVLGIWPSSYVAPGGASSLRSSLQAYFVSYLNLWLHPTILVVELPTYPRLEGSSHM